MHDVVVIALGTPLRVGVYQEGLLIESIESEQGASEALPQIFAALMSRYRLRTLAYAKGPGSFMGIKVAYLFLKTLSIVNGYRFVATDAFFFNENRPIKAVGKLYFVKNADTIETRAFDEVPQGGFVLPRQIRIDEFDVDTLPFYGIGAVG